MRAAVLYGPNDLRVEENVRLAEPRSGEVQVDMVASGVCHSDFHVVKGEWDLPLPVVLGHEGAGRVTRVGEGVESVKVGDHVVTNWNADCRRCQACLRGRPYQCLTASEVTAPNGVLFDGTSRLSLADGTAVHHYLGVSSFGGQSVMPETGVVKIDQDVPLVHAALLGCSVATGVGAVTNTANIEAGASVVVLGCGGVGINCVQGARLRGADQVIAIDLAPEKLAHATALGADETIDGRLGAEEVIERVRELTGGLGADYVFEAVGNANLLEQGLRMLARGGALVVVGLTAQDVSMKVDPLVLAESEHRILGSNYGSIRPHVDFPFLVSAYRRGQLRLDELVSHEIALDGVQEAFDRMAEGSHARSVIVYEERDW